MKTKVKKVKRLSFRKTKHIKRMKTNDKSQNQSSLFILTAYEKDRTGENQITPKLLSIYKTKEDVNVMISEIEKLGKSQSPFDIGENSILGILEIPKEITFGQELPSWKKEMTDLTNMLDNLMENISEETEISKEKN